jgi:adenylate kinase
MLIVFIGPPGAGKGTQCRRLVELLDIPHLSTGEMLRSVMDQDSALSRYVASYINAGKLAPDHLVMRIVSQKVKSPDCSNGALFDGFPRTMVQAQMLDDLLTDRARVAGSRRRSHHSASQESQDRRTSRRQRCDHP